MKTNISTNTSQPALKPGTTTDKSRKNFDSGSVEVLLNLELYHYLISSASTSKKHKLTKAEAFFDLVSRQRMTAISGDIRFLTGGIQELSISWHWSRDTVSKFISTLINFNVAYTINFSTSVVVILTNLRGLPPLPEELKAPDKILPEGIASEKFFHGEFCPQSVQNSPDLAPVPSTGPKAIHDPTGS